MLKEYFDNLIIESKMDYDFDVKFTEEEIKEIEEKLENVN